MQTARIFTAAFAVALSAHAADAPLPGLRIEPKTAGSIFFVHNPSAQPLTAFLIELVDYPGSTYFYWQDEPGVTVAPGATREIQVTNMTVGAVPDYVKLQAAIYADGSTAGVKDRVEWLIGRRRTTLETTREIIRRIEKAGSAAAAKTDLEQWSDGMPALTRANRNTAVGFNQSAAKSAIADTVRGLDGGKTDLVLARLKMMERSLASAKPAM
jgi:hypothetical protein